MANKNIGGRTQRFNFGYACDILDAATDPANDLLHDAQIIEDRDERCEKDNHWERSNGKAETTLFRFGEIAEQEVHTFAGIAKQINDALRHTADHGLANTGLKHQYRHQRLKRKGCANDPQLDRTAV